MDDDYHARSPEQGIDREPGGFRSRDHEGQDDDHNQSRQDYSRSPTRHDYYNDSRDTRGRHQRDMPRGRDYDYPHRDASNAFSGRGGRPRDNRHSDWHHDNQGGMYDDDYHRGRSGDNRRDDASSHGRNRREYTSRSPAGRYHSRSRSRSAARDAGRPSDTVILEGLPFNISTSELRESILSNSIAAEFPSIDVRVSSSKGNCRAFVQFDDIDHAVAFVKEHFPQLLITLPNSTDEVPDGKFNAYIHYARNREDTETRVTSGGNWTCAHCDFSNYASRNRCKICGSSPSITSLRQSLNPAADASETPSQILVVYPLPPFINEEMLATDMKRLELEKPDPAKETPKGAPKLKSTAPTADASRYGARPGSLHRVFLMRDPKTNEQVKYGFVEFWTLEDAIAAMTKIRVSRSFTVGACSVTVSHVHLGVFIPEEQEITPATEHMSFNPLFNSALRVRYRDQRAYPSQKVITAHPPIINDGPPKSQDNTNNSDAKKAKKRKADGVLGASTTKKSAPVMASAMAMWQKKHDEIHGSGSGKADSSVNSIPLNNQKGQIKISLTGATLFNAPPPPTGASSPPEKKQSEDRSSADKDASPAADASPPVSYVDRDRLMCLICMRKYKSVDEVNIHEKSRNHKTAMENDELVKAALPRLAIRDKRMQKQSEGNGEAGSSTAQQYRDRAKERRAAYNQPKKPSVQADKAKSEANKSQKKEESKAAASPPKPAPSKGAGMLAKMGWTAGSGLGAKGDGRTDVIATDAYQEGVGLGAEGAKLGDAADIAEKKTRNSYSEYVSSVQDKARERYNQMN